MKDLVVIAHNIRSTHNVGSLLRTADGLGIKKVFLTGYTPYPVDKNDSRMPHISRKINAQITKTSLGAESTVNWQFSEDLQQIVNDLRKQGYLIIGLEQASNSLKLTDFRPSNHVAVILGREVEGIEPEVLEMCDEIVEIPMFGKKESFNVIQAAAIFLSYCRFS